MAYLIMNQDLTSQNIHFPWTNFFKKVNKAMKMLTREYYGYHFANLIRANILQIVLVINYSIVTYYFSLVLSKESLTCSD